MPRKGKNDNRDYKKEYAEYHSSPEQKKNRAQRNAARREAIKDGRASKGDGTDVDHKKPIRSGGSNAKSNTQVIDAEKNKGWRKGKKGAL
jgi:hypothetical protein